MEEFKIRSKIGTTCMFGSTTIKKGDVVCLKRKPLTDITLEMVMGGVEYNQFMTAGEYARAVARAVEAAHGIK